VDNPKVQKMPGATKGNPGVCCLYTVRGYAYHEKPKGIIFRTGHAVRTDWYAQGRPATRSEVLAAIDASLPLMGRAGSRQAIAKRIAELVSGMTR
jgi:hypothetical protein